MHQDWPDGAVERIRVLLESGANYQEIADEFGRTRSSVAGYIKRNNLLGISKNRGGGYKKKERHEKVRPAVPRPSEARLPVVHKQHPTEEQRQPKPILAAELDPKSSPKACTFEDMDFETQCGWVVRDPAPGLPQLFCGNTKVTAAWCAHHDRIGKQAKQPRSKARDTYIPRRRGGY